MHSPLQGEDAGGACTLRVRLTLQEPAAWADLPEKGIFLPQENGPCNQPKQLIYLYNQIDKAGRRVSDITLT
jgi:hypothetical protein